MNAKMINSSIRSGLIAICIAIATWLVHAKVVPADQVGATICIVATVMVAAGCALWGVLEKKEPQLAAELAAIANEVGLDPTDLTGLTSAQASQAIIAQMPKPLPPPSTTGSKALIATAPLALLGLCTILMLGTGGCSTISTGKATDGNTTVTMGNTTVDVGAVASKTAQALQLAIQNAVPPAIAKNPSLRVDLQAVNQGLSAALGNGTVNISALETIVNSKVSAKNQPVIDEAMGGFVTIYEGFYLAYSGQVASNEFVGYAIEILTAANNGLAAGLAASPATSDNPPSLPQGGLGTAEIDLVALPPSPYLVTPYLVNANGR